MIAQMLAVLLAVTVPPATPPAPGGGTPRRVCDGALPDPDNRERPVPVRVRLPSGTGPHPVILFSHGLGGSVEAGTRWATTWAEAGFAAIHLQHPGSDALLWRGLRGQEALAALRKGMDAKQFIARVEDVKHVLDAVGTPVAIGECSLSQLDSARIGIAGHSFGAQTVQALAGQQFRTPSGLISVGDTRVRAAIAFSPAPARAEPDESAFGKITMPFLSVTGTRDEVPGISDVSPRDRTRPFHAMPGGAEIPPGARRSRSHGLQRRRATPSPDLDRPAD